MKFFDLTAFFYLLQPPAPETITLQASLFKPLALVKKVVHSVGAGQFREDRNPYFH